MSQLEVKILHQDYLLTCPEGQEAQLLEAAERVDSQLEQMRESGKVRSRERLGVLLAINLAYENLELRAQLKALQEQLVAGHWQEPQSAATEDELIALASLQSQQIRDAEIASALIAKIDTALIPPAQVGDPNEHGEDLREEAPLLETALPEAEAEMIAEFEPEPQTWDATAAEPAASLTDTPASSDVEDENPEPTQIGVSNSL